MNKLYTLLIVLFLTAGKGALLWATKHTEEKYYVPARPDFVLCDPSMEEFSFYNETPPLASNYLCYKEKASDGYPVNIKAFIRPHALLTILYAPDFHSTHEEREEILTTYAMLFPNCNLIILQWRSSLKKIYPVCHETHILDLEAAVRFCKRKKNVKGTPLFLLGNKRGALIALLLVKMHRIRTDLLPDALGCINLPADMGVWYDHHYLSQYVKSPLVKICLHIPAIRKWYAHASISPSLINYKPREIFVDVKLPVFLEYTLETQGVYEHDYSYNYHALIHSPLSFLTVAHHGSRFENVRTVPFQYKKACATFLYKAGLIDTQQQYNL